MQERCSPLHHSTHVSVSFWHTAWLWVATSRVNANRRNNRALGTMASSLHEKSAHESEQTSFCQNGITCNVQLYCKVHVNTKVKYYSEYMCIIRSKPRSH